MGVLSRALSTCKLYCNLCALDTNNGNKFGNNSHCLSDRSEVMIFVYFNARSLVHKDDGLCAVAKVSKLCLIESWLQLSTNIFEADSDLVVITPAIV